MYVQYLRTVDPTYMSVCRNSSHLQCYEQYLIDSVNGDWNNPIPVRKTRPQPDYSVGFRRSAFTDDQLKKIEPFVRAVNNTSFFHGHVLNVLPVPHMRSKVRRRNP